MFPLRAPASWWSAKCTRRLFKVWRKLAKFQIDMLFWNRRNLGFHLNIHLSAILKKFSNYAQLYSTYLLLFLYTVFHCYHWEHQQVEGVQSAHGGFLMYEKIGKFQNWYVILKEEKLGIHLNIYLSAILKKFSNYAQLYSTYFCCFFTLYCIVTTGSTSKLMECKVHTEAL